MGSISRPEVRLRLGLATLVTNSIIVRIIVRIIGGIIDEFIGGLIGEIIVCSGWSLLVLRYLLGL